MLDHQLDWLIIGQLRQAGKKNRPDAAWIREIVNAADVAKIPVFIKDNLRWLPAEYPFVTNPLKEEFYLRQEFPNADTWIL